MKRFAIVIIGLIFIASAAGAQDYNTGIGFRGGTFNGITLKHFVGSNNAIEGILSTRWQGLKVTGLYEIHQQAFDTPRLNWYYGVGGHIGFWNDDHYNPRYGDRAYTVIGVDGIIGIEYNIEPIPFNISLDWKPYFDFIGYTGIWVDSGALSIRYIF